MAQPKYIEKYLRIKPEVDKIFDDLEGYKNFCRFNMLKFDERDLYKSEQYRKFEKYRNWRNKQFDKQQNNF
jgi:hypothetical protein